MGEVHVQAVGITFLNQKDPTPKDRITKNSN